MTDEQVIKAMERCETIQSWSCPSCPYFNKSRYCVSEMIADATVIFRRQREKLEKAEECIWAVEDALDCGGDNDYAREAIEKYTRETTEEQK